MFSCEFCKIFKNTFFTEHLWTTNSGQIIVSYSFMCKISLHFHNLFFTWWGSCYWAINFVNVCSIGKLYTTELWHSNWKLSFCGATINLHQQNPCMKSGILFVTIPYCTNCTIYYLLYQEFFTYLPIRNVLLDFL